MSDRPVIGYVGMTHLGVCSASAAASKGFETIGFDPEADLVRRLTAGDLPILEPGLAELVQAGGARLRFSSEFAQLSACDLIYVSPDIPTDDVGRSDLTRVDQLLDLVVEAARPDACIVVLSQVPPGFARSRSRPGRPLFYQVETLIFGRAVERAIRPERFIVGCPDPSAPLPAPLRTYLESFACPILPMRRESAELAKISINACLVASVSIANTLAELCEQIGADWSEIEPALRLDRRIGPAAYLSAGLGIAGGNLERDLTTIVSLSDAHGTDAGVVRAFVANSAHRKNWVLRTLHAALLANACHPRLGILGLAYKENTKSVKNSPSLALIAMLSPWPVQVYDPAVGDVQFEHSATQVMSSALLAATGVDALAIMTPWPEFRALQPRTIGEVMRGRLVLDPFRVLNRDAAEAAGLDYRTLGAA